MKFENAENNHVEEVSGRLSWLWVLLFGPIYWVIKGIWRHAVAHLVLAIISAGLIHFIYPFFTYGIIKKHFLRLGWKQVE